MYVFRIFVNIIKKTKNKNKLYLVASSNTFGYLKKINSTVQDKNQTKYSYSGVHERKLHAKYIMYARITAIQNTSKTYYD